MDGPLWPALHYAMYTTQERATIMWLPWSSGFQKLFKPSGRKGKDIVAAKIKCCASSANLSSCTKVTSVKSREAGGKSFLLSPWGPEALTIERQKRLACAPHLQTIDNHHSFDVWQFYQLMGVFFSCRAFRQQVYQLVTAFIRCRQLWQLLVA